MAAVQLESNPQSLNRYAYVGGNPLAMGDPSGLDWKTVVSCLQQHTHFSG